MKRVSHFSIAPNWRVSLTDMGLDVQTVLAHANLSADLFIRPNATVTPEQYFNVWEAMDKVAGERNLPLLVAEHLSIESFDAPFFAAICNENLNAALWIDTNNLDTS